MAPTGVHCLKCPAGTYVKEHCKENLTNSTCAECPDHYYMDKPNNLNYCTLCRTECPKNSIETHDCTASSNRQCMCKDGFHKQPLDGIDPVWTCQKHTTCKEREGELYFGEYTNYFGICTDQNCSMIFEFPLLHYPFSACRPNIAVWHIVSVLSYLTDYGIT